jgi:hypothetical protein
MEGAHQEETRGTANQIPKNVLAAWTPIQTVNQVL